MEKRNLINLLLVVIAVVVVAICAFSVRPEASAHKDGYRAASGDMKAGPAARKCCCTKNGK